MSSVSMLYQSYQSDLETHLQSLLEFKLTLEEKRHRSKSPK